MGERMPISRWPFWRAKGCHHPKMEGFDPEGSLSKERQGRTYDCMPPNCLLHVIHVNHVALHSLRLSGK